MEEKIQKVTAASIGACFLIVIQLLTREKMTEELDWAVIFAAASIPLNLALYLSHPRLSLPSRLRSAWRRCWVVGTGLTTASVFNCFSHFGFYDSFFLSTFCAGLVFDYLTPTTPRAIARIRPYSKLRGTSGVQRKG